MNLSRHELGILLACTLTSGCVWWVDGASSHHSPGSYNMWFNDADVYCEYDTEDRRSTWTLVASPDTSYGTDEIESVWVEILGSYAHTYVNYFEMTPQPNDEWRYSFDNQGGPEVSYHCGNYYEFEFTAYNYSGYYTATWVGW